MISIGKRLLSKLVCPIEQEKDLTISILAIVLSIVMLSSWLQIILKYMLFFENLSLDPLSLVENFLIRYS